MSMCEYVVYGKHKVCPGRDIRASAFFFLLPVLFFASNTGSMLFLLTYYSSYNCELFGTGLARWETGATKGI